MRILLILFLFALLLGCSHDQQQKFNVSLFDASSSDAFISSDNGSFENFSFTIQNNELFDLDCSVVLNLSNKSNTFYKTGHVGILQPSERKRVSLSFEMFYGNSDIVISSDCKKTR